MCNYFSCIITRELKVLWLINNPRDHERIIQQYKLEDKKLEDRDFVRIEITPKSVTKISRDKKDWLFKVDEEGTLPTWFSKQRKEAEKQCWLNWEESIKVNIALDDEDKGNIIDGFILLYGSSTAVLYGSSTAVLYGSSRAELNDSSRAVLYDSSKAVLYDSSKAELNDSSTAELYDSSTAVLYGSSRAELNDSSRAELNDSSTAELYGSSTAVFYGSSRAVLYGSSRAVLYDSSRAELKSETSVALSHGKIYVHLSATIIKKLQVNAAES